MCAGERSSLVPRRGSASSAAFLETPEHRTPLSIGCAAGCGAGSPLQRLTFSHVFTSSSRRNSNNLMNAVQINRCAHNYNKSHLHSIFGDIAEVLRSVAPDLSTVSKK